jgi:hypothetical protein
MVHPSGGLHGDIVFGYKFGATLNFLDLVERSRSRLMDGIATRSAKLNHHPNLGRV